MFYSRLSRVIQEKKSFLCVGLDPEESRFPSHLRNKADNFFQFCKEIVDATAPYAIAYKPQVAYFSAQEKENELSRVISYIHKNYPDCLVILDAKRGDIDSTSVQYSKECFVRYEADAVTLNPYMGRDVLKGFDSFIDRGIFFICKTSNQSGPEFQNLKIDNKYLYQVIAEKILTEWNQNKNLGLVVGGTYRDDLSSVSNRFPEAPLLIPGLGAQGAEVQDILNACKAGRMSRILINASRSILYASAEKEFAIASSEVAQDYQKQMAKWFLKN